MFKKTWHWLRCKLLIPFKQEAGVIDSVDMWYIIYRGYMYGGKTLYLCYRDAWQHWNDDSRIVG